MPNIPAHIIQARQEVGQKIAAEKLPSWAACPTIQYPARLSMEQCSSEWTARYKSQLIKGETLVDLTGGLGVDCSFLSESFTHTTYVEQQAALCQLAQHNFACLGKKITVVNALCEDYVDSMEPVDVIFIDPARRDNKGGKVALLGDCTPNLLTIGNKLLQKCQTLLVKLSPMIDIDSVIKVFPSTQEVHIVAVNNECKEVLVRVKGDLIVEKGERRISVQGERNIKENGTEGKEPNMVCANLPLKEHPFVFTRKAEEACTIAYSLPQTYLYEPNAAILKAGAFKQVAQQMGVHKLHPNSHLYTSDTLVSHFPGRIFTIDRITKVQKKEINDIEKANLSIRNFPGSVADLRKKLKLKDGGDTYIFATTLYNNSKVLIIGRHAR
ncbi:MAG: SAM-dependent methyltransferase [Paludibacteraceae bacterium]|nr:SAM-dependent methyltransferase [Paludibacteraceae bacterium]